MSAERRNLAPRTQEEKQKEYEKASTVYANAIKNPVNGVDIIESYIDVRTALSSLVPSAEQRAPELYELVAQGEAVAVDAKLHGTVRQMQEFREMVTDDVALERGEYPLVESRIMNDGLFGMSELITVYERPDGTRIRGQSQTLELRRHPGFHRSRS